MFDTTNEKVILAAVGVVSAAAGAAVAYFVTKKQLSTQFEELLENELAAAQEFYEVRNKAVSLEDHKALAEIYEGESMVEAELRLDALAAAKNDYLNKVAELNYGYDKPGETGETGASDILDAETKSEVKKSIKKNIWENREAVDEIEDDFDLEREKENRSPQRAYIISHDEFFNNDLDYSEVTLTYFEGDSVLVDENENPIRDVDSVIGGEGNLSFGYGSKDKHIVYIRNEKLSSSFEVVRSFGTYTEEVLGIREAPEKIRKFRNEE